MRTAKQALQQSVFKNIINIWILEMWGLVFTWIANLNSKTSAHDRLKNRFDLFLNLKSSFQKYFLVTSNFVSPIQILQIQSSLSISPRGRWAASFLFRLIKAKSLVKKKNQIRLEEKLRVCLVCGVTTCFMRWCIVSSSHEFWWNQPIPHAYTNY
jgi:hypothetical protein